MRSSPELSSRTFWNFVHEFSSCRGRHERQREGGAAPKHGAVRSTHVTAHAARPRHSVQTHEPAGSSWSPVGDHAAAAMDGHFPQATDRFASMRPWRAPAARAVSFAGTVSPLPKYISSGVCPRNAECGSTVLCSWT
jgi:hypothetical protein